MSEIDVVGFNPSDFKYRKRVERYRIESKTDSRRNVSTPIDNNISQPEPVVNNKSMQNSNNNSQNGDTGARKSSQRDDKSGSVTSKLM